MNQAPMVSPRRWVKRHRGLTNPTSRRAWWRKMRLTRASPNGSEHGSPPAVDRSLCTDQTVILVQDETVMVQSTSYTESDMGDTLSWDATSDMGNDGRRHR